MRHRRKTGVISAAIAGAIIFAASAARAVDTGSGARSFYAMTPAERAAALQNIHKRHQTLAERVEAVSARFLGTPYKLGPLGEGPDGEFDRDPLMSFAQVDCTTFVEETMALALESDLAQAQTTLQKIRYRGGKVSYEARNHFTSADWVPNNVGAGYLEDITQEVAGSKTRTATKVISKRAWYAAKNAGDFKGQPGFSFDEKARLLPRWRALGASKPDQKVSLPYVPAADVASLISRIPSGTIANLVREDRPDKPVLVSHQVLLIRRGETLYVRHARYGRVVEDAPLLDYLAIFAGSKWPLLGLNLNRVTQPGAGRRH